MPKVSIVIFFLINCCCFGQIVINEIFPAPLANQSEWIEFYNPSSSDFTSEEFYITNRNSSIFVPHKLVIGAKSFAVICKDSTNLVKDVYCSLIQTNIPTLHNDYDIITIRNRDSILIDSIYYDFKWGKKGISLERYDWSEPAIDNSNWLLPTYLEGNSVCRENSRRIADMSVDINYKFSGNLLVVYIINNGRLPLVDLTVKADFIIEQNANKVQLFIFEEKIDTFPKKANRHYEYRVANILQSLNYDLLKALNVYASFDSSGVLIEKEFTTNLALPKPFSGLLINEFLYDAEKGCGEFIELLNLTNDTLSLFGWKVFNKPTGSRNMYVEIDDSSKVIHPNDYFVIIWDSSFFNCFGHLLGNSRIFCSNRSFSLKNGGDDIVVYDKIGMCQDSLSFSPNWHEENITEPKNRSLEKAVPSVPSSDSSNWFTCVNSKGATPGEVNSVSFKEGEKITIEIEPNPFSPNSSAKPKAKIRYVLPFKQARITGKILDFNGLVVCELINNELSPSSGEIEWDGLDFKRSKVPPGGYVLLFESVDIITNKVSRIKKIIAVGW